MDICMCICSVFVLSYLQVTDLWRPDHSSEESYRLCKKDDETLEEAGPNKGLMNEWMETMNWNKRRTAPSWSAP
jgi:hypothetical protein